MTGSPSQHEPLPKPGKDRVLDLVVEDLVARAEVGAREVRDLPGDVQRA